MASKGWLLGLEQLTSGEFRLLGIVQIALQGPMYNLQYGLYKYMDIMQFSTRIGCAVAPSEFSPFFPTTVRADHRGIVDGINFYRQPAADFLCGVPHFGVLCVNRGRSKLFYSRCFGMGTPESIIRRKPPRLAPVGLVLHPVVKYIYTKKQLCSARVIKIVFICEE